MISYTNPVKGALSPADVDRAPLVPQRFALRNGKVVYYFADSHIELMKIDFIFNVGTALQTKMMQAAAAINLMANGTQRHSSSEIAEFLDFRGIIMEKTNDEVSSTLTVYCMPRYLDELLPLVREMVEEAVYPQEEFDIFIAKRKQKLMSNMQRTSYVARKRFMECLYGPKHPMGRFAVPGDLDLLTVQDAREFHRRYLDFAHLDMVVGGAVTKDGLAVFDKVFGDCECAGYEVVALPEPGDAVSGLQKVRVPDAVQTTLRVGRRLPFKWNDVDYSRFMVVSTLLGGHFGSRLMSNIREDKGYTYGIHAMTQVRRGSIDFFITTDVAADKAEPALKEIFLEMERLCSEPVGKEELELVRNCMLGDFMRSVDGVFERSERFCQMMTSGVTEQFTDNYMSVLEVGVTTSDDVMSMAQRILRQEDMTVVMAGDC
ncbi:MAG: insulinase family protein [Bacteroidales bacterium]|nr:insulinase family protein [Bacteroidales bacterium]